MFKQISILDYILEFTERKITSQTSDTAMVRINTTRPRILRYRSQNTIRDYLPLTEEINLLAEINHKILRDLGISVVNYSSFFEQDPLTNVNQLYQLVDFIDVQLLDPSKQPQMAMNLFDKISYYYLIKSRQRDPSCLAELLPRQFGVHNGEPFLLDVEPFISVNTPKEISTFVRNVQFSSSLANINLFSDKCKDNLITALINLRLIHGRNVDKNLSVVEDSYKETQVLPLAESEQ